MIFPKSGFFSHFPENRGAGAVRNIRFSKKVEIALSIRISWKNIHPCTTHLNKISPTTSYFKFLCDGKV